MSQTIVALPRFIEIRSQFDKTLLRCVKQEGELKLMDYVRFGTGDRVDSADAKFEVHPSKTGNGLVHIRSCYNNKYLAFFSENNNWISAKVEKPEEDQSKRSCTLWRPTSIDGNPKNIRLTNVHIENYLWYWRDKPHTGLVMASYSYPDSFFNCDEFHVIDWQSLVFFPKYVVFKGENDKFLKASQQDDGHPYLQFSITNVEDDPMLVGHEIVQNSDGNISIRNLLWDKYWRTTSSHWIWADSTVSKSNETLFEPFKHSDDTIALKSVANKLFCKRLTADGKESCLSADATPINTWTRMKVSEFIMSRTIENVQFRLMDARIYGESLDVMVSSSDINRGSTAQEQTLNLSYTMKKSSTWSRNTSFKASIEVSFSVGGIPFIGKAGVKLGGEIGGGHSWGETKDEETAVSKSHKVFVPPNTKVTARVVGTRGTCDVPFSYTQRDVLYTGETVTTQMDDGVYTGVNYYGIYTETKEEPLQIEDANMASVGFKKVAEV